MSNLISKNDFYSRLLERSKSLVETIDDKECNRDVLKHNLNVLIDLCHKRLAINDDYHNSDYESETDEICLIGRQSEQTLEECIESAKKWLIRIKTDKGRRFKCVFNDCQSLTVYTNKNDALAHVWRHTGDRPYKCGESGCGYSGRWKYQMKKHWRMRHSREKAPKCLISDCDFRVAKQSNLKSHMNAKHNHKNDSNHSSDTDKSCLNGQQSDQTIMESTDRAKKWINKVNINDKIYYKCTFGRNCGIKSRSISSVVRHVWAHTDERPFKCDHKGCDYGCRSALQLKEHWLSHSGHEPYKWPQSGYDYLSARRRNMNMHL